MPPFKLRPDFITMLLHSKPGFLPQGERPVLRQFPPPPPETFAPPEIWSENNRNISITKEICITIDFAPLKKISGRIPAN